MALYCRIMGHTVITESLFPLVSSIPEHLMGVVRRNDNIRKWQKLHCSNYFWNVLQDGNTSFYKKG